jgi:mono/diheme cytochrome c family protein
MMVRRQRSGWIAIAGVAAALSWISMSPVFSQDRVSDEDLAALFHKVHNVMRDQRQRIHHLLDGFLLADLDLITRYAEEIERDMGRVAAEFPADPGREAEQWEAMAGLVNEARSLHNTAKARQYRQAFQHYANLTARCIACHQIRRPEARFEPPTEQAQSGRPSTPDGAMPPDTHP